MTTKLLGPDEPAAVTILNDRGASPILLVCDHAGRRIPRALGDLGVSEEERHRHIAWDIGAAAVTRGASAGLDATAILQTYSRLVIDCNRDPSVPSAFAEVSESTEIPGNRGLGPAQKATRVDEIFRPYHDAIAAELDRRAGRACVLVAVHSFTPVYRGVGRPWEAAVLYNRDPRFGHLVRELLAAEGLVVGDNEPYSVSDETDYTIPVHAERRRLPYLEIEIRQDLVTDEAGQAEWAARLVRILPRALDDLARR